jgi:hypothetical protein
MRTIPCFPVVLGCFLAIACVKKEDLIIWKSELKSPDGTWVASADTVQNGGFGSAHIDTSVYLKQAVSKQSPIEVLGFGCDGPVPHPYVLDNVANRGGTINLTMKWMTPSHLHVTYEGHPDIKFQAVRVAGIEITLENRSSPTEGH